MTIRILVADDHPVVRAGTIALIGNESDMTVVAEAADGREAVALYASHLPDVALIDLRMPVMDGISAMVSIFSAHPEARLVALTTYDGDADIYRALDSGACGYLIKDMLGRELVQSIRVAASGKRVIPAAVASRLAEFTPRADLTEREVEVLHFAAKGLRNKEIAHVIGRTEGTVKVHLKHLMARSASTIAPKQSLSDCSAESSTSTVDRRLIADAATIQLSSPGYWRFDDDTLYIEVRGFSPR